MAHNLNATATFTSKDVARVYFLVIKRRIKCSKEHQKVIQVVEAANMAGAWVAPIQDLDDNDSNDARIENPKKFVIRAVAVDMNHKTIATVTRGNRKFP